MIGPPPLAFSYSADPGGNYMSFARYMSIRLMTLSESDWRDEALRKN